MARSDELNLSTGDPLIDEVRGLRRAVCDQFGNDIDRLADHLEQIEREYQERSGRFADIPRKLDRELFTEAAVPEADHLIEEARSLKERNTPGKP